MRKSRAGRAGHGAVSKAAGAGFDSQTARPTDNPATHGFNTWCCTACGERGLGVQTPAEAERHWHHCVTVSEISVRHDTARDAEIAAARKVFEKEARRGRWVSAPKRKRSKRSTHA